MTTKQRWFAAGLACAALGTAGCAYEVGYRPDYVPEQRPPYVADGRLLIVMPEEQRSFVYEGRPSSTTGDYTTLTVPLGEIVRDIALEVFGPCFAKGVDFVDGLAGQRDYVLAIEGDMHDFTYSYTKIIDEGFAGRDPTVWITPQVDIAFHVKAYDGSGRAVLDKVYASGVASGEAYLVASQPAERINRTLHATLHALMIELAADVKPILMSECRVEDVAREG